MRWVVVPAVALLTGCGRVGFAPLVGDGGDATDAIVADSPTAAACTTWGPWGTPTLNDALSTGADDWLPRISRDNLSLLIDFWNGSEFDVAISRRTSSQDAFPPATVLTDVMTANYDQVGQFSPSEDRLYVMVTPVSTPLLHEYELTGATYKFVREHTAVTPDHFSVADNGLSVYWLTYAAGPSLLQRSTRNAVTDAFGPPATLTTFPFGDAGATLALSPDELTFVVSMRPSNGVDMDLFYGTRSDRDDDFLNGTPLPFNTVNDDVVGSISTDLSTLYLNLDTETMGGTDADVSIVVRPCLDP